MPKFSIFAVYDQISIYLFGDALVLMADPSGAEVIFTYSELTENSMKLSNQLPFGLDNVTATLAPEKITIMM